MELLDKKGNYDVKQMLCDSQGNIQKIIYECDKVFVKTAQQLSDEAYFKNKKKREEWDDFKKLINSECGSFYLYFYNKGLYAIPIKESIKIRFLYLCTYVSYTKDGAYLVHDNNRLMNREALEEKLGLSKAEFNRTMKVFLETGLLVEGSDCFLVNKNLVKREKLSNKNKNDEYTRVFDNALRELYISCTSKQHKQLYYLFRLLPFINEKFNAICQNPSEKFVEHVIPLRLSEICQLVGYNTKNSKRFESEMLQLQMNLNGVTQYAILGIKNGKGMWYKVNPRVLYAGTKDNMEELYKLLSTDFRIK